MSCYSFSPLVRKMHVIVTFCFQLTHRQALEDGYAHFLGPNVGTRLYLTLF